MVVWKQEPNSTLSLHWNVHNPLHFFHWPLHRLSGRCFISLCSRSRLRKRLDLDASVHSIGNGNLGVSHGVSSALHMCRDELYICNVFSSAVRLSKVRDATLDITLGFNMTLQAKEVAMQTIAWSLWSNTEANSNPTPVWCGEWFLAMRPGPTCASLHIHNLVC